MIKNSRIVFGYLWPNLYYQIEEDLIVCTLSRCSSVTGVTNLGTTTPLDLPSPPQELHEIPLPPPALPKLPALPGIADFNQRTEALCQRIIEHNQQLRNLSLTPNQCLSELIACIRSGENLDEIAFTEGNITYHQLWRIDQGANPHLYIEVSQLEDADYQPPYFQDDSSQGEEEEKVEEEEERPLPVPGPSGSHLEILHSEHNSPEQYLERDQEKRITGRTPWNNNRGNIPAARITGNRLEPEVAT